MSMLPNNENTSKQCEVCDGKEWYTNMNTNKSDVVGLVLFYEGRVVCDLVFENHEEAEKYQRAFEKSPDIVPIYLQSQPTLTDEEKKALRGMLPTIMYEPDKKAIESILARLG